MPHIVQFNGHVILLDLSAVLAANYTPPYQNSIPSAAMTLSFLTFLFLLCQPLILFWGFFFPHSPFEDHCFPSPFLQISALLPPQALPGAPQPS